MFGWFKKQPDLLDPNEVTRCVREKKFDEALERIDAILKEGPEIALSHRYRGEILFELDRFSEAEKSFLEAERLGGVGTDECFFWRALAAANIGESSRAVSIFNEYIQSPDAKPELVEKCRAAISMVSE